MTAPALQLTGIHKNFGSVHALRGADFTLMPGEIHALLGENGAGKTTLMQVAYGMVRPDAGAVRIGGAVQQANSPRNARRLGVGMVHQHFSQYRLSPSRKTWPWPRVGGSPRGRSGAE